MFYCFDKKTKRCHFSINELVPDLEDFIVIESYAPVSISRAYAELDGADKWVIVEHAKSSEELAEEVRARRIECLKIAQENISLLRDVDETSPKIKLWESYRHEVYKVSPEKPDEINWPTMPERDV